MLCQAHSTIPPSTRHAPMSRHIGKIDPIVGRAGTLGLLVVGVKADKPFKASVFDEVEEPPTQTRIGDAPGGGLPLQTEVSG